ncbi:hypothetical protein GCM10007304_29010 [Rhodococcoides trifolii]|uniref:YbaB/EbfC family DNA-binding protein n=1 Tax=Rhodococcoides trifolii TaxID=908250 RepID=A0A917FVY7_9NOCA|nr:hypothetical protein [Rhodococcus trifolii]GGG13229.1 hypothetical protein GCM10007304_29010 [Rhodococcus trifolii]
MTAASKLDAMHDFLERTAAIRAVGEADFGVRAVVDGSGRLVDLSMANSLRGVRADRLAGEIEVAAGRAADRAAAQRAELVALLHSSLSAP